MTRAGPREALAEFLRSRRAQLSPEDVGLASVGRRRTPGLRREEISQLSGVSVTWYTWLEQGREIKASSQVVRAIGRALRLDDAEMAHLTALAGHAPPVDHPTKLRDGAPAAVQHLLDAIHPNPAFALSWLWDVVAWNDAYVALFPDIAEVAEEERNLLWLVFTRATVRELASDWEAEGRRLIAQFRAEAGPRQEDEACAALVTRLSEASAEFRGWWARHDVAHFASRERDFRHPVVGRLVLEHHKLALADDPRLHVVVYTPVAGTGAAERLARLVADRPERAARGGKR